MKHEFLHCTTENTVAHGLQKLPSVSSDRDGYLDLDLVHYIRG